MDGTPFGRYRLIELLGCGGMGEVWRAQDTETNNRTVAIKVLPAHLADDDDFARRFRREADVAARLDSPHVVPIYDYGEIDSRLFVCMRLIKGRDLDTVLADGPLEPVRAVRIIDQVAKALHAAHKAGLIHRDIKPSNILLDDDDFAYLIDFGIARVTDDTRMTKTGSTIGTFAYIAPERLDGRAEEDARADIYSLACVLYEALTGEPPFAGSTTTQLMYAHAHTPPPRPSATHRNVPAQFDAVIATGMAKTPDQRYATTIELADAAHDAITVPIERPSPRPATLPAATRAAPTPAGPQQLAESIQRATQQHPPGWPGVPQARHADSPPPQIGTSPPQGGNRQRRQLKWPLIAAIVVILGAAGTTAYFAWPHPSPSQTQTVLPFTDIRPAYVAVDTAGNVYLTDYGNNRVLRLSAGSNTQTVLPFTGLNHPTGVAVDTVGNLYVNDQGNNRVLKLEAGSNTQTMLPFTGLNHPTGVAVDTAGNLYISDLPQVLKLAAGSSTQTVLLSTDINTPVGVAVDTAGNLYITDLQGRGVLKLAAGSATPTMLPFTGLNNPNGVAVDTAGNLYVTDTGNSRVLKLAAGSNTQTVLPFTGLNHPTGVAVDTVGNLYVNDPGNNRVVKLPAG